MRSHALAPLVVALTLATFGCNETTPTTPPEPGDAAPTLPADAASEGAQSNDEMFDDEPEVEDARDVDDGG